MAITSRQPFCDGRHIPPIASVLIFSKIAVRVVGNRLLGLSRKPAGLDNEGGRPMISAKMTKAVVLLSAIGLSGVFGLSPSTAQEPAADVAYVASVSGRAVALV